MEPYDLSAEFDLIKIALIFLIILGVFLLYFFKKRSYDNIYVYPILLIAIVGMLNGYLKFFFEDLDNFIPVLNLLFGPTLLFYYNNTVWKERHIRKEYVLHLSIGIIGLIFVVTDLLHDFSNYLIYFMFFHFGVYLFTTFSVLISKKIIVLRTHEKKNNVFTRWSTNFNTLLVITIIYISLLIEAFFTAPAIQFKFSILVTAIGSMYLLTRLIYLKFIKIYRYYNERNEIRKIEKYKDSVLSKEQSKTLAIQLENLMHEKKPYLEDTLDLKTLAIHLKTHPKNLSQAINENFNRNFFDYINTFRVEEAKSMLVHKNYKDYKIYEIMYEVGFNSRSSFNSAFKKVTGLTAKQYRDRNYKG